MASPNTEASDTKSKNANEKSSPPKPRLPSLASAVPIEPRPLAAYPDPHLPRPPPLYVPGVTQCLWEGKPVACYNICDKKFIMLKVENETLCEFVRTTVGGRNLRYRLHVIQEPAKARACGSGPRSSADRRPVDPPPVVSLNIYDMSKGEDITMSYDSGFMLYASLEVARPIANGKMHNGPPCLPVLTGVCVASTAYLERPNRAGYFIFPDLSVRHEGWYRLKFSLFEQIKHASDADTNRPFTNAENSSKQVLSHESMANRMEVQSTPFQVFSAKKFPGLSQSTDLSKVVADQGCRVRIRREIRQRKRTSDDKPDGGRQTPDVWAHGHSRTESRNSMDGHYAPIDPNRRPSMESLYHRQVPSRAPSIASLSQASPTTPTAPHMVTMPPPMHKAWEQPPPSYNASLQSRYTGTYYQHPSPARPAPPPDNLTLPPISPASTSIALAPPVSSRYYQTHEPTSTKRASDRAFNDDYSMKAGARPDQPPRPEPVQAHGFIEADNGEDEDADKGDYFYSRANGSRGLKVAQLLI